MRGARQIKFISCVRLLTLKKPTEMLRTTSVIHWIIILINLCPIPRFSFAQDDPDPETAARIRDSLFEQITRLYEANLRFDDCLDKFKIPYNQPCDVAKLVEERNRLRTKYGLHELDLLTHSEDITLEEWTSLAKLDCLPDSSCNLNICNCGASATCENTVRSTPSSRPDNRFGTDNDTDCNFAHEDLLEKLDTAVRIRVRLLRRATTTTLPPGEVSNAPPVLDYLDLTDADLIAGVRRTQTIRREDEYFTARSNLDDCLDNFRIQPKSPCNVAEFWRKEAQLKSLLSQRGGDEGRIPLNFTIEVAKSTCRFPSECLRGRCVCRNPYRECVETPQNQSATCDELFLDYLTAKNRTNRPTSITMASGKDTNTDIQTLSLNIRNSGKRHSEYTQVHFNGLLGVVLCPIFVALNAM